jgi:hypothetical protein
MNKFLLLLPVLCIVFVQVAAAQDDTKNTPVANQASSSQEMFTDSVVVPQVRKSPMAIAKYKSENTYIKVVYSQPFKRGREIFGELEPYGQVWRTGANEATEITTTRDIRFGGKELKAGTYTIFTIPNKDKWTVIINRELGQWGAYKYEKEKDLFSFDVPVTTSPIIYEAFTIDFQEAQGGVDMTMLWDTIRVAVPIKFSR